MPDTPEAYTARDKLAFRSFARDEFKSRTFDLGDWTEDSQANILDTALASIRILFAHAFQNVAPDGTPFRVFPAYIESLNPNAFAGERNKVHLCGVHLGLAESFYEFSMFCLSQKTLLSTFGDPSVEASPECIDGFPPGFWLYQKDGQLELDDLIARARTLQPTHLERKKAAEYLAALMLRFVWLHELCHCLNGHVGLTKQRGWAVYLHEHGMSKYTGIANRQLQCLEFDADQSATLFLCKIQSAPLEHLDGFQDLPLEERLHLSIFAAYAAIWILDEYARGRDAPQDADHPDPYLRLLNMIMTLASHVAPEVPGLDKIHDACLEEVNRVAEVIPSFFNADKIIRDFREGTYQAELEQYQNEIMALHAELTPFRFSLAQ